MLCRGLEQLSLDQKWNLSATNTLADEPSLTSLLQRMRKTLPQELIVGILNYLQASPLRSLFAVNARNFQCLLHQTKQRPLKTETVIRLETHISAHFTQVKGTHYICGLDNGKRLFGYPSECNVISTVKVPSNLKVIKFRLGLYGIQHVLLQGEDGTSYWAGDDVSINEGSYWKGRFSSTGVVQCIYASLGCESPILPYRAVIADARLGPKTPQSSYPL